MAAGHRDFAFRQLRRRRFGATLGAPFLHAPDIGQHLGASPVQGDGNMLVRLDMAVHGARQRRRLDHGNAMRLAEGHNLGGEQIGPFGESSGARSVPRR